MTVDDKTIVGGTAPSIALPLVSGGSRRTHSTLFSLVLVSPLLLLIFFGFVYPVGEMLVSSLFSPGFTLDNYARIFTKPLYLKVLYRTLEIALLTTLGAFVLGYPVAFAMARAKSKLVPWIAACVLIPLWTSVLVRSYAWILLLQRKGIVNNFLIDIGLIDKPLKILYTEHAVLLAMVHVLLPFMILPVYGSLRSISVELPRAAKNLGAGPVTVFKSVYLPLSLPGIFAGSILVFILALGFFVTPALVGGPTTLMMATLISQQTTELLDWEFAAALSTLLLVVTLVIAFAFRHVLSFSKGFSDGN